MAEANEESLVDEGALPPSDFHNAIERLREIAPYELEMPSDLGQRLSEHTKDLVLPSPILGEIAAALRVGHVVLQGPPGTGKTSLARAVAKAFNVSTYPVTAHEDWTIYDVIGRLELRLSNDRKEEIVPVNGAFTEAVIRCGNNIVLHFDDETHPQAEWLLLDELNRCRPDKAFGELFTVLGTDELIPTNLPHQPAGNRELVIPRRFRIIATLNSYDKQFVQSLSQAIRRRFTFISLDVPERRPDGKQWAYDPEDKTISIVEFTRVIERAAFRVAQREAPDGNPEVAAVAKAKDQLLKQNALMGQLFDLIELVRYAGEKSDLPYLPIGTAQIIDTIELFLSRLNLDASLSPVNVLDWAVSVKIAPLFESDVLTPDQILKLVNKLPASFLQRTKRELQSIAAAGTHFVG
jgi:MoxR-like ATPase